MPLFLLIASLAAAPADKLPKALPVLTKAPAVDGQLADLAHADDVSMPKTARTASASLTMKAATRNDVLYVGVSVQDDKPTNDDRLDVTVFFLEAGTTARGVTYRFAPDGSRASAGEADPPPFAAKLVSAATARTKAGWALELAIPARAMPRFPAFKPMTLTLCADYRDIDDPAAAANVLTSCPMGDMAGGPTRFGDTFRKTLKLSPPADVEGLEAREQGWLGISKLHYPTWVSSEGALTPERLISLVAGASAVDPTSVAVPVPKQLQLHDNRMIFPVLTGKNPYVGDSCDPGQELRLALYVVNGTSTATRVLEWPAVTCSLGRAMRFELSPDGTLVVGFTNGATQHFVWTTNHFERSELGLAAPHSRAAPQATAVPQSGSLL